MAGVVKYRYHCTSLYGVYRRSTVFVDRLQKTVDDLQSQGFFGIS